MCHLQNSTPTAGLEVSLGFLPLHLHIQEIALKTYLRICHLIDYNWTGLTRTIDKGHIYWCHKHINEIGLKKVEIDNNDIISKTINGLNKFNINFDSFTQQGELFPNGINIYTDGSKGPYGSGSGFIIYNTPENIIAKQSIALGPCPTVF